MGTHSSFHPSAYTYFHASSRGTYNSSSHVSHLNSPTVRADYTFVRTDQPITIVPFEYSVIGVIVADLSRMVVPSTTPPLRPRLLYLPSHLRFALRVGNLVDCTFSATVQTRAKACPDFHHSTMLHNIHQHTNTPTYTLCDFPQYSRMTRTQAPIHRPVLSIHVARIV